MRSLIYLMLARIEKYTKETLVWPEMRIQQKTRLMFQSELLYSWIDQHTNWYYFTSTLFYFYIILLMDYCFTIVLIKLRKLSAGHWLVSSMSIPLSSYILKIMHYFWHHFQLYHSFNCININMYFLLPA